MRKDHRAPHPSQARGGTLHGGHVPKANREWWVAKLAGNTARDRRADAVLRAGGWRVLRFWEHEDPDAVADAICAALGHPASGR
jgi:DNA mismatch endonuclease (patch repair protein)